MPVLTPFHEHTMIKKAKRLLVAMMGGAVLALGVAWLVLVSGALVAIPAALGILSLESGRVRGWFREAKHSLRRTSR